MARKKAEGVVLGRPIGKKTDEKKYKLYPKKNLISELLKASVSRRKIAVICKVDRNTLCRFVNTFMKEYEHFSDCLLEIIKTDFALVGEVIMLAMQMAVGWSEG